jgi:hypothetical protein
VARPELTVGYTDDEIVLVLQAPDGSQTVLAFTPGEATTLAADLTRAVRELSNSSRLIADLDSAMQPTREASRTPS